MYAYKFNFFIVMSIFHLFSKKWNSILDCRIICSHWDVKKNSYFLKKKIAGQESNNECWEVVRRSNWTIIIALSYIMKQFIHSWITIIGFFFFRGIIIIASQFCLGLLPNKCEKFYKILLWLLYSWYYMKKCYNLILIFIGKKNFHNIFPSNKKINI